MNTEAMAIALETTLHQDELGFAIDGAVVMSPEYDIPEDEWEEATLASPFSAWETTRYEDPYQEDLWEDVAFHLSNGRTAALVVTGWAAPLMDDGLPDGPPSVSPDRRRVRVMSLLAASGVTSIIRFEDTDETLVDASEDLGGPLAERFQWARAEGRVRAKKTEEFTAFLQEIWNG